MANAAWDEHSAASAHDPELATALAGRLPAPEGDRGQWSATIVSSSSSLEIPNFDRSWHPNEIGEWMTEVEEDESISEEDIGRARKAVSQALGVD